MPSSRVRIGVLAAVLGLVAVLGVVWLVRSATTGGGGTSAERTNGTAEAGNGTGTGGDGGTGEDGDTGTGTDGGRTAEETGTDGGRTTDSDEDGGGDGGGDGDGDGGDGGRRSISVNGVRINGSGTDGCLSAINLTDVVATMESISFTVTAGPSKPTVRSDNGAHCPAVQQGYGRPCAGAQLQPNESCTAGAVLASNATRGTYSITAVATASFRCENSTSHPCDLVEDWEGSPPTPQNPVSIEGKTDPDLTTTITRQGTASPRISSSPPSSPAPE
ncbi:MAG TPA: hypothetical protein VK545_24745 [Streptomyces sp.]|nr:hypothetical protein [Streptomyces sp.]